jgi:hypothetical protein
MKVAASRQVRGGDSMTMVVVKLLHNQYHSLCLHAVVPNHIGMPVRAFIDGIFVRTFERATHEKLSYDFTG